MEEQQQAEVKKVIWVAVKEKAREVLGQPKATRVRRGRRGDGRRRAGVTGALDIYAPEEKELIPDAPRMATNPALHGGAITNIPSKYLHDVRQRRHEKDTLFHFSQEAIAHANYLQQTQGSAVMNQYLQQIKERKMDSTSILEGAQKIADDKKHQSVAGDYGQQLLQAEAKAKHFREEAGRLENEADQQDKIALKLREIMEIMGGHSAKKSVDRAPHGEWNKRWKELATTPILKKDLIQLVVARYGFKATSAYQTINKAVEKGKLRKLDGGMVQYVEADE